MKELFVNSFYKISTNHFLNFTLPNFDAKFKPKNPNVYYH